jgi:hypothetical protein
MRYDFFAIRFQFYLVTLVAIALVSSISVGVVAQSGLPVRPDGIATGAAPHRSREIDARVSGLIRRMTLAEKIGQLQQVRSIAADVENGTDNRAAQVALQNRPNKLLGVIMRPGCVGDTRDQLCATRG